MKQGKVSRFCPRVGMGAGQVLYNPKKKHTYLRHLESFTFWKTLRIGYSFHGFVCSRPLFPRNICLWDLQHHTTRNGSGLPPITAGKPQETRRLAYSSRGSPSRAFVRKRWWNKYKWKLMRGGYYDRPMGAARGWLDSGHQTSPILATRCESFWIYVIF